MGAPARTPPGSRTTRPPRTAFAPSGCPAARRCTLRAREWRGTLARAPPARATALRPPRGDPPLASAGRAPAQVRSEEHTSELQSRLQLVCRLLLVKKKNDGKH